MSSAPYTWWGRWFPRGQRFTWWRRWFPEPPPSDDLPASTPSGIALILEKDAKVTYVWRTGIFKALDGRERRSSLVDDPAQLYDGSALLVGAEVRAFRARLARYAALGNRFNLGLPFEELLARQDSLEFYPSGLSPVGPSTTFYPWPDFLAIADWAKPGVRVIARHLKYGAKDAVIQSVTADSIKLSPPLGDVGKLGCHLMPAMSVLLEAQQSFQRFTPKVAKERWSIRARAAEAGYLQSALPAKLLLADPVTISGALEEAWFEAREQGLGGNAITVKMTDNSLSGIEFTEDEITKVVEIKFEGDSSTVDDLVAAVEVASTLVKIRGDYTGAAVLASIEDEIDPAESLSGGSSATPVEVGAGATITMFLDSPVWDQGIRVPGSGQDSLTSMAAIVMLDGLPYAAPTTDVADWGRAVSCKRPLGPHFQWAKKFFWTIRGAFLSFWLPTWREDLVWISSGAGTLIVDGGEDGDDVAAWFPRQRECLQIVDASNAITYARVTLAAAVPTGVQLTIVDEDDNPITIVPDVTMISWLERVRLDCDDAGQTMVPFTFVGRIFEVSVIARTVQQDDE